jgi:hypothetical protein
MKMVQIFDHAILKSGPAGEEVRYASRAVIDGLAYKSLSYYLMVWSNTSDTATFVGIDYAHGPDGENWEAEVLEASAAADKGIHSGPSTADDIVGVAKLGFSLTIKDGVGSAGQVADVSLWVVMKPF